ncbi:methyltransferase family protein [Desulfolutivibrio sp.]|uniref:methyltransferase family protein n=1 Tax=Desulfolutivibrio sp. TaxID=2773296 RepID=UPI002F961CEA
MALVTPTTSFEPIESILYASTLAKGLMAALDLDIFGQLAQGDKSAGELAAATGTQPDRLEALLDLLTARGVLVKAAAGYANSPAAAEYLTPDRPLYQGRAMALNMQFFAPLEADLTTALRRKERERHEVDAAWAMEEVMEGTAGHAKSGALVRVTRLASALPGFAAMRTMADVGGNHGEFTMALLDENPKLVGTIFDLPHVAPLSEARCRARGYGDRVTAVSFDLRTDAIGKDAFDLALASHVLYGVAEDLERSVGTVATALRPGGWMVSHHFAPGGRDAVSEAGQELLTRLAGYPTHFLPLETIKGAMARQGLGDFVVEAAAPPLGGGLIVAGRKG